MSWPVSLGHPQWDAQLSPQAHDDEGEEHDLRHHGGDDGHHDGERNRDDGDEGGSRPQHGEQDETERAVRLRR